MSLPRDTERDPHADALLTSALSAVASGEAGGCPDAEVIGLYAERAIAGAELRAVEAHVQACPRCQATVAAFVRALPDEAAEAAGAGSGAAETSAGGGFAAGGVVGHRPRRPVEFRTERQHEVLPRRVVAIRAGERQRQIPRMQRRHGGSGRGAAGRRDLRGRATDRLGEAVP